MISEKIAYIGLSTTEPNCQYDGDTDNNMNITEPHGGYSRQVWNSTFELSNGDKDGFMYARLRGASSNLIFGAAQNDWGDIMYYTAFDANGILLFYGKIQSGDGDGCEIKEGEYLILPTGGIATTIWEGDPKAWAEVA